MCLVVVCGYDCNLHSAWEGVIVVTTHVDRKSWPCIDHNMNFVLTPDGVLATVMLCGHACGKVHVHSVCDIYNLCKYSLCYGLLHNVLYRDCCMQYHIIIFTHSAGCN